MNELVEINMDDLHACLYLEEGEVYRVGSDKAITEQHGARINGRKVIMSRIIFALEHGYSPTEYLLLNDGGNYVEVGRGILQMFNYRRNSKTKPTEWSKSGHADSFTAHCIDHEGQRVDKAFPTAEEAIKWQREAVDAEWGEEFKELGIYDAYFNPDEK